MMRPVDGALARGPQVSTRHVLCAQGARTHPTAVPRHRDAQVPRAATSAAIIPRPVAARLATAAAAAPRATPAAAAPRKRGGEASFTRACMPSSTATNLGVGAGPCAVPAQASLVTSSKQPLRTFAPGTQPHNVGSPPMPGSTQRATGARQVLLVGTLAASRTALTHSKAAAARLPIPAPAPPKPQPLSLTPAAALLPPRPQPHPAPLTPAAALSPPRPSAAAAAAPPPIPAPAPSLPQLSLIAESTTSPPQPQPAQLTPAAALSPPRPGGSTSSHPCSGACHPPVNSSSSGAGAADAFRWCCTSALLRSGGSSSTAHRI